MMVTVIVVFVVVRFLMNDAKLLQKRMRCEKWPKGHKQHNNNAPDLPHRRHAITRFLLCTTQFQLGG